MLIITADDYGETSRATDCILKCFRGGRLTCASAMVFMEDSERAAALARDTDLEVGLHLNLTETFTGREVPDSLRRQQARAARYLNAHRYAQAVFNPLLVDALRSLVKSQWTEFERLYGRIPDFVNGHHHMHLCANVLCQRLLPLGSRLRTTFSFQAGEKGQLNRYYRSLVARHLKRAFIIPDSLYSIQPISDTDRVLRIAREAQVRNVELEVHPEDVGQEQFLLSPAFLGLLQGAALKGFSHLNAQV